MLENRIKRRDEFFFIDIQQQFSFDGLVSIADVFMTRHFLHFMWAVAWSVDGVFVVGNREDDEYDIVSLVEILLWVSIKKN